MKKGDFGLTAGGGWPMLLIRAGTFSRYGHVVVCTEVGEDAVPPRPGMVKIVQARPSGATEEWVVDDGKYVWSNIPLTDEQREIIVRCARECIGLPYDWQDIFGFIFRRARAKATGYSPDHPDSRVICSEIPAWAFKVAGVDMYPDRAPGDVSPSDLADYLVRH